MRAAAGPVLSLRHLLILLTAIGLLPLALLGVWTIHGAGLYLEQEQERMMIGHARALSSAVDAELDATVAALSGIAKSPQLAGGDLRGFHETASRLARPDWLGVVLSDADGRPLFRTMAPYGAAAARIADPGSLRQAMEQRRPMAGHVSRGQGGRAAVPVRVPVTGPDGQPWVLTAVVQPDRFLDVIARQKIPADSVIAVMDGGGALVARSRDQERTVVHAPSDSLQALMRSGGPEGVGPTTTLEGDGVISAYTTSPRYGWRVAVGAPSAGFGVGFLERFAVYLLGAWVVLSGCIALASWLSGRIVRRIEGVQAGATALGSARAVRVAPSRIREIRAMGQALEAAAERRAAQEQERSRLLASLEVALAQARQAGQAKDAFLAMLGHELRNPLSPILTALDLMDLRDEPGSQRERAIMRRQVTHLRRLVDDLLDVSRIASGKLAIDARPLDLAETVRHAVAALPAEHITLEAPDEVWVVGDETRLAQVLGNLLSNAVRFGSSDTRVTLAAADGQARLFVSDNGAGMDPELLARVFEPFYQAPQPLARRTGGLGLGLAIVREIVELHGGRVAAFSAGPGAGSRFEVVLPLGARQAPGAPDGAAQEGQGRRVLLVDDNEDAAAAGALLLRHLGHAVRVAHSAAEARALALAESPEVAILDIGLPDMDGHALAAALRADLGAAGSRDVLRLVALTGYGQQADVARALAAGFDVHLTKPATIEALRGAVAAAPGS
ncbi:hybrid sensor histidine kinase/response regulator [Telluria beijingensis]|uniref:hybrid sensor histidine kinase/response regulator n=1 Tax=Telluria beijingensis TaxID=3068633 RepID=UPI00279627DB|nr:ATP-binding protein [Massilia sp. REN29]